MKVKFFAVFFLITFICLISTAEETLTAPKLTNNPTWDVIVTNTQPLFSFFNSTGGEGKRTYTIQIDTTPNFDSPDLIEYKTVPEKNQYITDKRDITDNLLKDENNLIDKTRYYWRVKATDATGATSKWATSRFYLDTAADDSFMDLVRIPVEKIEVSSGSNPKNIIDLDDPGQSTFWQSTPPGSYTQWVKFDLGKEYQISRIWMLSNPSGPDGWLKDFVWQVSADGETWIDIHGTAVNNNDTFRNILNFPTVKSRYVKLLIKDWHGYAPQINTITLYSPGTPPIPLAPEEPYVLLVGNQENGFTFSALADFVESLPLKLKTITVPHYEVSLDMVNKLRTKPVAIILSGNNADYPNLPMFEYNGEYELIRESDIPILGICCGHQQLAMAYGYTFARSMGWEDISSMETAKTRTLIEIKKEDPVFKNISNPYTAVEIHGWAVAFPPEGFEILAASSYIQAMKNTTRMVYGEQFHAEIKAPYNESTPYLVNFLKMALKKKN